MSAIADASAMPQTVRRRAGLCMATAAFILATPASGDPFTAGSTINISVGVSDLYSPFFTDPENLAVLDALPQGAEVSAIYEKAFGPDRIIKCVSSGSCYKQARKLPGTPPGGVVVANISPDNNRSLSIDLPKTVYGSYKLSRLRVSYSPEEFYRQRSYQMLLEQTQYSAPSPARVVPRPELTYYVELEGAKRGDVRPENQTCLPVYIPHDLPEFHIPIVTQVTSSSKGVWLSPVMSEPCSIYDSAYSRDPASISGKLPPSRIAIAQVAVGFADVYGRVSESGDLPVTKDMTRWFGRNADGVSVASLAFGRHDRLALHMEGDTTHPSKGMSSTRDEAWLFLDGKLVGRHLTVIYHNRWKLNGIIAGTEMFNGGQRVWSDLKTDGCEDPGCMDALATMKVEMSKTYDALAVEVEGYKQLGIHAPTSSVPTIHLIIPDIPEELR